MEKFSTQKRTFLALIRLKVKAMLAFDTFCGRDGCFSVVTIGREKFSTIDGLCDNMINVCDMSRMRRLIGSWRKIQRLTMWIRLI